MAFLLLLHQKMRLQRKENALTLKQLQFSSKVDRMQKKVDKRQKYYDKLKKQIERQANCYKNSMNMQISNMFGLGTNSINLGNPYASSNTALAMIQNMTKDQMNQALGLTGQGDAKGGFTISDELAKAIQSGCVQVAPKDILDTDGKTIKVHKDELYNPWTGDVVKGIKAEEAAKAATAYQQLQQQAQMQITQMQTQAQQFKAAYENNVSIWTEAQLEQLEAQEEWEMDLLSEEQADMEAEKNSIEVQLQRVQEEKKNVEQALGNAIQDSAPKFGLG